MCGSVVDIQSATAEIRRGKKKKKEETTAAKYRCCPVTQRLAKQLSRKISTYVDPN